MPIEDFHEWSGEEGNLRLHLDHVSVNDVDLPYDRIAEVAVAEPAGAVGDGSRLIIRLEDGEELGVELSPEQAERFRSVIAAEAQTQRGLWTNPYPAPVTVEEAPPLPGEAPASPWTDDGWKQQEWMPLAVPGGYDGGEPDRRSRRRLLGPSVSGAAVLLLALLALGAVLIWRSASQHGPVTTVQSPITTPTAQASPSPTHKPKPSPKASHKAEKAHHQHAARHQKHTSKGTGVVPVNTPQAGASNAPPTPISQPSTQPPPQPQPSTQPPAPPPSPKPKPSPSISTSTPKPSPSISTSTSSPSSSPSISSS